MFTCSFSYLPRVASLPLAAVAFCFLACKQPSVQQPSAKSEVKPENTSPVETKSPSTEGMALIPAGKFLMGDTEGFAHETPVHEVELDAFWLDTHEVTNDQFGAFVEATGYVTEAENWGWSIGYRKDVDPEDESYQRVPNAPWWIKIDKADWRHPTGPDSDIDGLGERPVVQVSWNDAIAYCNWMGKRLPTEAEWEYAARGGLVGMEYSWGDELMPEGKAMSNTWQGFFPANDEVADGWDDLAPVGTFSPNGYGLYDICGNVWEWCSDWYESRYYEKSPAKNPPGPDSGTEKIMRGGSWMCASNYCLGYRVAHRNKTAPDSGINNTGFRCALDAE